MTFGYNLARLNNDPRHPGAGYRYAVEDLDATDSLDSDAFDADAADRDALDTDAVAGDEPRVLRAEFTPTTAFCPQSDTLTRGTFRAWNGLVDRHEFDLVRVRVAPMHQRAVAINGELKQLETAFPETGEVPDGGPDTRPETGSVTDDGTAGSSTGGPTAPF
jgi:hypothetical protein